MIHVRFRCGQRDCKSFREWAGDIEPYQLTTVAVWFHSHHEGHTFDYWENGHLLLKSSEQGCGTCSPVGQPLLFPYRRTTVEVVCAKGCGRKPERVMVSVDPHQVALPLLQLHTQHGACGLEVRQVADPLGSGTDRDSSGGGGLDRSPDHHP